MEEYASRFFLLLKHAARLNAQEKLEMIQIASSPYMKPHQSKQLINHYKKLLQEDRPGDYATIEADRKALLRRLKGSPV